MKTLTLYLSMVLALLTAGGSAHDVFSRWRRQAIHCQAGDAACQKCSSSCSTVTSSHLPECCEAYNACCDEYFQACKQCSSIASQDRYFPEYCCASFTKCCEKITTFTAEVKAPAPVRPTKEDKLKIPTVPAPKPPTFPGRNPPSLFETAAFATEPFSSQASQQRPLEPVFSQQRPAAGFPQEQAFNPRSPSVQSQQAAFTAGPAAADRNPTTPSFSGQVLVGGGSSSGAVDNSQRQRTRTQARAQVRPSNRGQQQTPRRKQNTSPDLASRRGRVTSRGRVAA